MNQIASTIKIGDELLTYTCENGRYEMLKFMSQLKKNNTELFWKVAYYF